MSQTSEGNDWDSRWKKKNCQILKSITRHNCATSLSDRERLYDFSVQYVEVCEVLIVSKIGKFS